MIKSYLGTGYSSAITSTLCKHCFLIKLGKTEDNSINNFNNKLYSDGLYFPLASVACVHLGMEVYICVGECVGIVCACACEGVLCMWRTELDVGCLSWSCSTLPRQGFLLNLEFVNLAGLSCQLALGHSLSQPSKCWDYRRAPYLLDVWMLGI